ncbi:MAG: PPE domain-containing protein [Pseudonocardiaceae bacterium]
MRATTCENYGVYQHRQICHEVHDGVGVGSQGDVRAGWQRLAGNLTQIRDYVDSAVRGVRASQRGAAGDAAAGALVPMVAWVEEAQRLVNDTRNRIDDQISAFLRTRGNVPEVPPEPRGGGWKELPLIDSFSTSDQEADEAFNAEQERQARAAMMAYQNDTNERVMGVPQFAPPPTGELNLDIPTAKQSEIGGFPGDGGVGSGGGGASTPPAGTGDGTPTELAAVPPPSGGHVAPPPGAPIPPPGGSGGPVVPPLSGGPVVPPPGARPAVPVSGAGSRGPGSGGMSAGRGGPGGAGMRGGPGTGRFRPQGGALGAGGFGPDRGGFGPTGSSESAAARAAGAGGAGAGGPGAAGAGRGAGGAGGVPFGGMGAGRGGEDNERRRPSYLIEPDSNRLIGELPWTAPAVIGEDPPDYDESDRR